MFETYGGTFNHPWLPAENNHNDLTWTIWGIMFGVAIFILLSSIIYFAWRYKKDEKKFLTSKKVIYMSIYLGFFIIHSYFLRALMDLPIPFAFESVWVITVAFIYGPLEGILFGWVADSLRVILNGWAYGLLPSLMYPLVGLISGIAGYIYRNKENISKNQTIIYFQIMMGIVILGSIPAMFGVHYYWGELDGKGMSESAFLGITIPTVVLMFALMEGIFFWLIKTKNKKDDLLLFMILSLAALSDRGMELVIRPFTQYFTGYDQIYSIALITRIISSVYLIPTVALASYGIVKVTYIAWDIK